MALNKTTVPIDFASGIDTKSDEKLTTKLLKLENGIFKKRSSIIKRNGYRVFDNLAFLSDGSVDVVYEPIAANVFQDEILMHSNDSIYSRVDSKDGWVQKTGYPAMVNTTKEIMKNGYNQSTCDMAVAGNIEVYAWQDSRGGVRASVIDTVTGNPYLHDYQIHATATKPRCFASGSSLFVFYTNSTNIYCKRLDATQPTLFLAQQTITNTFGGSGIYDIDNYEQYGIMVYTTNGSPSKIKICYITRQGVVGSSSILLPDPVEINSVAQDAIMIKTCIDYSGFEFWIFWFHNANGITGTVYAASLVEATTGATVLDSYVTKDAKLITGEFLSTGNMRLFYQYDDTYDWIQTVTVTLDRDPKLIDGTAPIVWNRNSGLASKAFKIDTSNDIYVNVVFNSSLQATNFTARCSEAGTKYFISKHLNRISGGYINFTYPILPQVCIIDNKKVYAYLFKNLLVSEYGEVSTTTGVARLESDYGHENRFFGETLGKNFHITGGILFDYDGFNLVEHNFLLFPEGISGSSSSSTGSMVAGTYWYYIVYEWTDRQGQIHRSAPSAPYEMTMTGGHNTVTLTIPTLHITNKPLAGISPDKSTISIAVYRTEIAGTDSSVAYRVSSLTSFSGNNCYCPNDPLADTTTFVDGLADGTAPAGIFANEILYTTGGVLENTSPDSCKYATVHKNRLILLVDNETIQYSKEKKDGNSVEFTEEFKKKIDPRGGAAVAVASLDSNMIIFKRDNIYVISGDGANALGENETYSNAELITTDCGCIDANSIVSIPSGIMFQSNKGIYIINRNLQVEYIGADVEKYNSYTIKSAQLLSNVNQVRFLTNDKIALVYDYYFNQWSIFTNHSGLDSIVWQNNYIYIRDDYEIWKEEPNYYFDNLTPISLTLGTAWIKLQGIQNAQRVYKALLLGDYKTTHRLQTKIYYDYDNGYEEVAYWSPSVVIGGVAYGLPIAPSTYGMPIGTGYGGTNLVYQVRINNNIQKCQAIRYEFCDVDITGESFTLTNLSLDVGVKRGLKPVKAERRITA